MRIHFGESAQSTLGLEWELAIVDLETLEQVPAAEIVLAGVDDPVTGPIRGEYLQSMLELVSGVHTTVADAVAEMDQLLHRVIDLLEPHGCTVLAMGAHPFGDPSAQLSVKKAQYRRVRERNGWWGEQMAINGFHIHTGVAKRDHALPVTYGLARFIPYFIALGASSPFWQGTDTMFASQRTMIFQQLPTNGLPYYMTSWAEYERYATELEGVGLVQSPSEIRWDVRPSTYGTVENRSMDCVPTTLELGALAALSQCLVEWMVRRMEGGETIDRLPFWFMRENKWRAARYGLAAEVITTRPEEHTIILADGLAGRLAELAPVAEQLGCAEQLADCADLMRQGPSYVRQRRVHAATGGDMQAVVRSVISETMRGRPQRVEAEDRR